MEPASSDQRVGDSRKRGRAKSNRKSFAESPASPLHYRSSHNKRKREEESEAGPEYHLLRSILKEKRDGGRVLYLIDWEDNPDTGEQYRPSWEPAENVNEEAVTDWERKKNKPLDGKKTLQKRKYIRYSSHDSASESLPTFRANRSIPSRIGGPSSKKPRRVGTADSARFQSVSQEDLQEKIVKDSYEEELTNSGGRIRVIVSIDKDFDRNAYGRYSIESSQPSQISHLSHSSHLSDRSQPFRNTDSQSEALSPPLQPEFGTSKTARNPFLWDEDLPVVIPDSQFLPGSSSFKPTETPASKAESNLSTRPDTAETSLQTPFHKTLSAISQASTDSGEESLPNREHPSSPDHILTDTSAQNWNHCKSSGSYLPSGSVSRSTTIEVSQPKQLSHPQSTQYSNADKASFDLKSQEDIYSRQISSQILPSQGSLPSPVRRASTWSEEAQLSLDQERSKEVLQSQIAEDLSSQFQTQLPLPSTYQDAGSLIAEHHVFQHKRLHLQINKGNEGIHNQVEVNNHETESRTPSSRGSRNRQSLHTTQRLASSFEATWQAAQIISPDSRPPLSPSPVSFSELETILRRQGSSPERTSPDQRLWASFIFNQSKSSSEIVKSLLISQPSPPPGELSEIDSSQAETNCRVPHPQDIIESIELREDPNSALSKPSTPSGLTDFPSTYGSNLPPRPSPSVSPDMDVPTPSVAEMFKAARVRAAAKAMQQHTESREISSIPTKQPPHFSSQMLPLRDSAADIPDIPIIVPQSVSSPKSSQEELEPKTRALKVLPFGAMVFALPLPMVATARAIYETEIKNNRRAIMALNEEEVDPVTVRAVNTMINHLNLLCDHQSLVEPESATQEGLSDRITTRFAENVSTKCQFIAGLFKALKSSNEHVAILVRPGRMINILEAMCREYAIPFTHPHQPPSFDQPRAGPLITLITTGSNENSIKLPTTSLVVAFDESCKRGEYADLRVNTRNPTQLTPLVHLVVTHSSEHLELCIDESSEALSRITDLINGVCQIRPDMGKLRSEDHPDAEEAGGIVARYLISKDANNYSAWPLLQMPDIEGIEFNSDTPSGSEAKPTQLSESTTKSISISTPPLGGFKRPLGLEEDSSETSKRQRFASLPSEQSSRLGDRHSSTSDDVQPPSNDEPGLDAGPDAMEAEKSASDPAFEVEDDQADQVTALLKKISLLEEQMRTREVVELELRQQNLRLEARCDDYEKSIRKIQPKYQEALNDQGRFQHEITETLVRENSIRKKFEAKAGEIVRLREKTAAAEVEVSAARVSLSTSAIPEIAEFSKLKGELDATRAENDRLQKRITNLQSEIEYMRGHYQQASSSAAEAAVEIDALKEQTTMLKVKASDNARQIHEIQASNEIKLYLQKIETLEAEKGEVERELEKKTEELRAMLNGRRTTRGTSVPRSPRMPTMSPNVRERPMRVLSSGVGSRGNSPAPSEYAPTRGNFGDGLFADKGTGNGRFGNHLY